jgi:hypothetical protein
VAALEHFAEHGGGVRAELDGPFRGFAFWGDDLAADDRLSYVASRCASRMMSKSPANVNPNAS